MANFKKPVKCYLVDVFTDSAFKGNPALVCVLDEESERDSEWMKCIAREFNAPMTCFLARIAQSEVVLSDTAVVNPRFHLRWFTPFAVEVELCGHATVAAAHHLFSNGLVRTETVEFSTLSGVVCARKLPDDQAADNTFYVELDFPIIPVSDINCAGDIPAVAKCLNGASVVEISRTAKGDLFVVLPSADAVVAVDPDMDEIKKLSGKGMILTGSAPSQSGFDFFSRVFWPKVGVPEDPVCGSAHCALAYYWHKKLGKCDLVAYAASARGGVLKLHVDEDKQRVLISGKAVAVMEGLVLV
nr:putative PhzC/PhzF-type epimerase [Ipomoea batatas]